MRAPMLVLVVTIVITHTTHNIKKHEWYIISKGGHLGDSIHVLHIPKQ
jgi:bacteriorhodopsin